MPKRPGASGLTLDGIKLALTLGAVVRRSGLVGDWGGIKRQLNPIGKPVSFSFRVRVVRACVRSCVSAGGRCSSTLEARMGRSSTPARLRRGFLFLCICCYTHGF